MDMSATTFDMAKFTGHFDPAAHAAMLKAYDHWDTVMMPVHAADHAYLGFEQMALPVAAARGGQPVEIVEPQHLPALRAEPTGRIGRHLWLRHSGADGRQHPCGAELPEDDA
jgi:hypothetical protein